MNKLVNALVFVFLILLTSNSYSQNIKGVHINNSPLSKRIDSYLESSVTNGFSGAILVSKKGQILLSKGYGWADRKNKISNTSSTVFNIGSVSKQFTAAGILKLVELGRLKTLDKIEKFFPEAPQNKRGITVHQLLTHTSGISPQTGGFRYEKSSKEEFLEEFYHAELINTPGTKHQYANANYILLAAIIEEVSQQDYDSFLRVNIWNPLRMHHTGYKSVDFKSEHLAHGYYFQYKDGEWKDWGTTLDHLPQGNDHWYSIGKGDIHSTVEDLFKWHSALEKNEIFKLETKQLIESEHVRENENGTSYYGYGWAISKSERNTKIVTHNGSNGVYFSDFVRFIDDDVAIIYMTNAFLGHESERVAWEISKMVFDQDYNATPLSKNIYELILGFIDSNDSSNAHDLPDFLEHNLNYEFNEHSVLNRLGYSRLKIEEKPGWGLELFKLNVQFFPEDGNLWDSLGEAYLKYGLKKQAMACYSKAVELGSQGSKEILDELIK